MLSNPLFRNLFVKDEPNGEIFPSIDTYIFAAIVVCGSNGLIFWAIYNLFDYSSIVTKYILNILSYGNELSELTLITISIILAGMMLYFMKGIADILDKSFTKLTNLLKEKETRIKELDAELTAKDNRIKSLEARIIAKDIRMNFSPYKD